MNLRDKVLIFQYRLKLDSTNVDGNVVKLICNQVEHPFALEYVYCIEYDIMDLL